MTPTKRNLTMTIHHENRAPALGGQNRSDSDPAAYVRPDSRAARIEIASIPTVTMSRKRGVFGWFWLACFVLFQVFMIWTVTVNMNITADQLALDKGEAYAAGTLIGSTMIATAGWFAWFLGTVILGLLVLATPGKIVAVTK